MEKGLTSDLAYPGVHDGILREHQRRIDDLENDLAEAFIKIERLEELLKLFEEREKMRFYPKTP